MRQEAIDNFTRMRLTPREMQNIFLPNRNIYCRQCHKVRIRKIINIDGFTDTHKYNICFCNDNQQQNQQQIQQQNQPQNQQQNQQQIQQQNKQPNQPQIQPQNQEIQNQPQIPNNIQLDYQQQIQSHVYQQNRPSQNALPLNSALNRQNRVINIIPVRSKSINQVIQNNSNAHENEEQIQDNNNPNIQENLYQDMNMEINNGNINVEEEKDHNEFVTKRELDEKFEKFRAEIKTEIQNIKNEMKNEMKNGFEDMMKRLGK